MSTPSDNHMIQRIRQGSKDAWNDLIAKYEGRLQAYAYHRLHDAHVAQDVVQETFLGFLVSLANYDEKRDLQNYLFSIAANKVRDNLRKKGRRTPPIVGDAADELLSNVFDDAQIRASTAARRNERVELEHQAVMRSMGQLIQSWKANGEFLKLKVFELLFVKGWANRDVARHLAINEQQVANIRFSTLKKMHEQVRKAGLPGDVFPELQERPEV